MSIDEQCARAAKAILSAKALIVTAGAGMGVDSGLPDFRGNQGFWNAYPMYERLGLSFVQAANPEHFERDPAFGWGFYGHRTNLYRSTVPHQGFGIIRRWIGELGLDHFVVTSNVDGQFQKAGFDGDSVLEVHGSIHHLQCTIPCGNAIWDNDEDIKVDTSTMRAANIPKCRRCGRAARPNILMFGDYSWLPERTRRQERLFDEFVTDHRQERVVVLEMGAGTAIPTIRYLGEQIASAGGTLVRINPREAQVPPGQISIPLAALAGLKELDGAMFNNEN